MFKRRYCTKDKGNLIFVVKPNLSRVYLPALYHSFSSLANTSYPRGFFSTQYNIEYCLDEVSLGECRGRDKNFQCRDYIFNFLFDYSSRINWIKFVCISEACL